MISSVSPKSLRRSITRIFRMSAFFTKIKKCEEGMTMIEVLVMTALIAIITTILVGGFPIFNENIYVKKEAEHVALQLRGAQNNAILGRVAPTAGVTPLYWGLRLDLANPSQIIIFADLNENHQYNAGVDEIFKTVSFENGVKILALDSPNGAESELNFFFVVPYGDTEVYKAAASVGSWGKVTLTSTKPGITRAVTMRVSGQISITKN